MTITTIKTREAATMPAKKAGRPPLTTIFSKLASATLRTVPAVVGSAVVVGGEVVVGGGEVAGGEVVDGKVVTFLDIMMTLKDTFLIG